MEEKDVLLHGQPPRERVRFSDIVGRVLEWPAALLERLGKSRLGRFFLSYEKSREVVEESRFTQRFVRRRMRHLGGHVRRRITSMFATSPLHRAYQAFADRLRYTETRAYGLVLFIIGLSAIITSLLRFFVFSVGQAPRSLLVIGIVVTLFSFPLLFNRRPLCVTVQENRFFDFILHRLLGLHRRPYRRGICYPTNWVPFMLGIVLGMLGLFISPLYILAAGLLAVAFFLMIISPELCLFGSLFAAPFLIFFERPGFLLSVVILIGLLSYAVKVMLGKRTFSFEPLDFCVLALSLLYLGSSVATYGAGNASATALMTAILLGGYFLAVNILNTRELVLRAINTLLTGGGIVAAIGLFQQIGGQAVADWLDSAAYSELHGRITAVFANPNILAVYLILLLPFAAAGLFRQQSSAPKRIGSFTLFVLMFAALVYTWSRGAWLGAILSFLLLLLALRPALVYLLLPTVIGLPFVAEALSGPLGYRLSSIFTGDSSILHRLDIWRGSLSMIGDHLLGGIGVGEGAFSAVFPLYAVEGSETVPHAHNLLLQLTCETGIVGLLVFLLFLLLFFQCILSHQHEESDQSLRLYSIAAGCGAMAVLFNGLTDYVFYNSRVFFLFFAVVGIAAALSRVGRAERMRPARASDMTREAGAMDILIE